MFCSKPLQFGKQNCQGLNRQANFSKLYNGLTRKKMFMHFEHPLVLQDMNADLFIRRHAFVSSFDYRNNCLERDSVDYQ